MCTLRNFPSQIEHCIEWGRAMFEDFFAKPLSDAKKVIEDRSGYVKEMEKNLSSPSAAAGAIETIQVLLTTLQLGKDINKCKDKDEAFHLCLKVAFSKFHELYRDKILNLVKDFPETHLTKEGKPFWAAPKRFPLVQNFDANNLTHLSFIMSYANILAVCYGVMPGMLYVVLLFFLKFILFSFYLNRSEC